MTAIAADPSGRAPNSAEMGILRRIEANWRARSERCVSFYFAWDSRGVLANSWQDGVAIAHCECWFKANTGNDKFRIHTSATDPKLKQQARADDWHGTFDGKTTRTLDANDLVGIVQGGREGDRMLIEPLLYAMRPAAQKVVDLSSNKVRVIDDNAHIDQRRCIKLGQDSGDSTCHCWVDPEREDVIAGLELLWRKAPSEFISIEYKRENNEWLPAGWTETFHWLPGKPTTVSSVTKRATNEKFNEKMFVLEFPPGAVVLDKKLKQNYVVQKNGTTKALSSGQLRLYESLEQGVDFTIEPEPLKNALDFIAQRYQIKVTIDPEATRKGLIDLSIDVQSKTSGIPLKKLLRSLLDQPPRPLTYEARNGEVFIVPVSRSN